MELWAREYEEIDIFNWQEAVSGMISASDLEVELSATEGRIRSAVTRGVIVPDHTLPLGERTYYYFAPIELRRFGRLSACPGSMMLRFATCSWPSSPEWTCRAPTSLCCYCPSWTASMNADEPRFTMWSRAFTIFIWIACSRGLPAELAGLRMQQASELSKDDVRSVMLRMPFRKFEQKKYLSYDRHDVAYLRFEPALWRQLTAEDFTTIRSQCQQALTDYYERIGS